jgi:hypothetical protein
MNTKFDNALGLGAEDGLKWLSGKWRGATAMKGSCCATPCPVPRFRNQS